MTLSDEKFSDKLDKMRRASAIEAEKVVPLYPPADDDAQLPGEYSEYKAAALQSNKGLVRLCCILNRRAFKPGGKPWRFFQYVHLDSDADFGFDDHGQVMTLRFAGMSPVTIVVRGRNLLQTCDYIQSHRMAWIREADRDFGDDEAVDHEGKPCPIITRIDILPAMPPGRAAE